MRAELNPVSQGDARRGPALAVAGHRRRPRSRRRVLRQLRVGVRQPEDRGRRPRAAPRSRNRSTRPKP